MRVLIQRVLEASVEVEGTICAQIAQGLLLLVGVEHADEPADAAWLATKVCAMRIFDDALGVMNLSVMDVGGDVLAVSQFTLHALTQKGNRPSYIRAAKHEQALALYNRFCDLVSEKMGKSIKKGIFAADMKVRLLNDGPVTIGLDSRNRE